MAPGAKGRTLAQKTGEANGSQPELRQTGMSDGMSGVTSKSPIDAISHELEEAFKTQRQREGEATADGGGFAKVDNRHEYDLESKVV